MIRIVSFLLPYAAYAASARDAARVLYRCDIVNDKHGIAAFTSEGELIGAACDTRLGKSIDQAITIDVTHAPPYLGNISIGDHSFSMHSNPSSESEPVCGRIYNDRELEIDCSIPKHSIDQAELAEALEEEHGSCFEDISATDQLMKGSKLIDTSLAAMPLQSGNFTGNFADDPTANLSKRQGGCSTSRHSRLVDNGDPHQDYLHRQTNAPHDCGLNTCSAGTTDGSATAFAFNFDVHPFQWISGGFAVTTTYTDSETYSCNGEKGETICIWYKMAYTGYTIQNYESTACEEGGAPQVDQGDPIILQSPNENGKGSNFYCVTGTCRTKSEYYWQYNARAGGP